MARDTSQHKLLNTPHSGALHPSHLTRSSASRCCPNPCLAHQPTSTPAPHSRESREQYEHPESSMKHPKSKCTSQYEPRTHSSNQTEMLAAKIGQSKTYSLLVFDLANPHWSRSPQHLREHQHLSEELHAWAVTYYQPMHLALADTICEASGAIPTAGMPLLPSEGMGKQAQGCMITTYPKG